MYPLNKNLKLICKIYPRSDYNLNLMIYSGDDDAICATLGSQQFVWDLGALARGDLFEKTPTEEGLKNV